MKKYGIGSVAFLILALAVTGCAKKVTEDASLTGTGFESLSTTDELAQLPQTAGANQQAAVEILPIEASPVTQAVPSTTAPASSLGRVTTGTLADGMTHEQKIQTALKNAGLYSGNIDGKIGPASRKAIEEFQKANGLKADGKVGPKTWVILETYLAGASAVSSISSTAEGTNISVQ